MATAKRASRTCSRCGATASCAPDGLPEGWSFAVERRGLEYMCPDCARANLRAIEAKLPQDYWEF